MSRRHELLVAAVALLLVGCGGAATPTTTPTTPAASRATARATTDASACATFGDAGVEARLNDVYADQAASQALVAEYSGAPRFQEGLEQTLELLRSSGGELEGDFLAQACGS